VTSVDDIGEWTPAPAPHRHMAAVLRLEPGQLAMAAVHTWDMHGAARAGLTATRASCLEGAYPPTFDPPDVPGRDLVEVIEGLVALTD